MNQQTNESTILISTKFSEMVINDENDTDIFFVAFRTKMVTIFYDSLNHLRAGKVYCSSIFLSAIL